MTSRAARTWHLLTCAVAVVALVLQLVLVVRGEGVLDDTDPPGTVERTRRFFFYFTIQSNALVAWTCWVVARRDVRADRVQRVLRLDAVAGITVTGLVHFVALRPLLDLSGGSYVADKLLHVVVPLMAVAGWALLGPRGIVRREDLLPALAWPVAWLVVVLATGPLADWYPYPFIDVAEIGLARVLLNCLGVAVLFLGLCALALVADRRLPGPKSDDAVRARG